MKILIASDFHLGLSRKANFTAESSARREQVSRETLRQVLQTEHDYAICVGDFFDKYSNPENTILESVEFFREFDIVLKGNHDSSNRSDTNSSLDLLHGLVPSRDRSYGLVNTPGMRVWLVPHCPTQEMFLAQLDETQRLARVAADRNPTHTQLLFLHCNYACDFDLSTSSLNLPRERAAALLETFHWIFLGHEHTPREDFNGRLVVVGSHYPTAFSDLNDKRHLVLEVGNHGSLLSSVTHWRAGEHVYVGPGEDAPGGLDFYDLSGDVDPKLAVHLFKAGALGVRVAGRDRVIGEADRPVLSLAGLPQQIARELARNPELLAIWESLQEDEVAAV